MEKQILINKALESIDKQKNDFIELSTYIWNNPELGYEEHKACKILSDTLKNNGFEVQSNAAGLPTAFVATKKSTKKGPCIALMSEYDALPEIGHACGHNLFSVSAVATALALADIIEDIGGCIKVVGTPAEEGVVPNAGGKIALVEDGVFDDVDIALICHAEGRTIVERKLVATASVQAVFHGKSAHIGCNPPEGVNALTAGTLAMNNINAMRWSFPPRVVIGTKVTEGGIMETTIPEKCVIDMSIRAVTREILADVLMVVENCVKAGAIATGCTYEFNFPKKTYENIVINHNLAMSFKNALDTLGVSYIQTEEANYGWDAGNVSHVCPTIAPYIKIGKDGLVGHSQEFKEASCSKEGFEGMIIGAKAMAITCIDYLTNEELRINIKEEFKNKN